MPNNLQKILDENAIKQSELRKASKLSTGLINQTCRNRIDPKLGNQEKIVIALNALLVEKSIPKTYVRGDIFFKNS